MAKHDLRLPETDALTYVSALHTSRLPVQTALEPKPTATRTILDHMAPCWHCSARLQACTSDGERIGKPGLSPNYSGCSLAFVAEIDGYMRRLHGACAEELGFRISLYTIDTVGPE